MATNTTAPTTLVAVLTDAAAASGLLLAQVRGTSQAVVVERDLAAITRMLLDARAAQ